MNLQKLLFTQAELKTGETRNVGGQLAICVSTNTNFGPMWAIENRLAKFSTQDLSAYIVGVCLKIDARLGLITMKVVKGFSDSAYSTGSTHALELTSFGRYFTLTDDEETDMRHRIADQNSGGIVAAAPTSETVQQRLAAKAEASRTEAILKLSSVVGDENYQWLEGVISAYGQLSNEVSNYQGRKTLTTRPAIAKALKKLQKAMADQPLQSK